MFAGIAQLVEQLICNQQVVGSNPTAGSILQFGDLERHLVQAIDFMLPY